MPRSLLPALILLCAAVTLYATPLRAADDLDAKRKATLKRFERSLHCFCGHPNNPEVRKTSIGECQCALGNKVYRSFVDKLKKTPAEDKQLDELLYTSVLRLASRHRVLIVQRPKHDSKKFLKEMSKLKCMCLDCPYRPMDNCNCGYAQRWRRLMRLQFLDGKPFKHIATFYAIKNKVPYDMVLTHPNKALSWIVPLVLALGVLLLLGVALSVWSKRSRAQDPLLADGPGGEARTINDESKRKLAQALRAREREE